jgi:hypothetical protein
VNLLNKPIPSRRDRSPIADPFYRQTATARILPLWNSRPLIILVVSLPLFASCSRGRKNTTGVVVSTSAPAPEKAPDDPLNPSDPVGQAMLGWKYHTGKGVVQDFTEGVKWYRKAGEQGVALAQVALGVCYASGEGVERDYTTAAEWFRKAAEQGDPDGQFRLGMCYNSGAGTDKDFTRAYMWYNLVAASKNKDVAANAKKSQAILAKKMSQKEIADAQRMSREWKKK